MVEVVEALVAWRRRVRPGGLVSQGGHDLGAVSGARLVAVLTRDDVSELRGAGSRVPQCPRTRAATDSGWAAVMGRQQTR